MKPDALESLLLDRTLGELTPETAALLEAYLAQNPAAAARAAEYGAAWQIARTATATTAGQPRPFDGNYLRRHQRAQQMAARRTEFLRLAACLAIGLGLGWLGKANYTATAPAPVTSPAVVATPAAPGSSTASPHRFWSVARFAPEFGTSRPSKAL